MEYVKKEDIQIINNSDYCTVRHYQIEDQDISTAVIEIAGRYPDLGLSVNQTCKLIAYILKGNGKLTNETQTLELSEGDMVLIKPMEKYFWEGNMTLVMSSTPGWYPEQYSLINEQDHL